MEINRTVRYTGDPFDEEDDVEEFPFRNKGMRKMTQVEEKKFPGIVADSLRCQYYHVARFERCNGCDFAINGCEKIFAMSAG